MNGERINQVEKLTQLGVVFNARITFNDHIKENCDKGMKRIVALKRISRKLPRKSKLSIYVAFVRPVLEFGWQLYTNCSVEILKRLERVQRKALLVVTGAYKKTSHKNILKEVGQPTLFERRQMQKLFFMHKHDSGEFLNT